MKTAEKIDLRTEQPPQKLGEIGVTKLRSAIISAALKGGDCLAAHNLSDQIRVSKSVIRESIRYLEVEGLAELQAKGGPVVAQIDWPLARQIYDIRFLHEEDADPLKAATRFYE